MDELHIIPNILNTYLYSGFIELKYLPVGPGGPGGPGLESPDEDIFQTVIDTI